VNPLIRKLYLQAHAVREYPQDDPHRGGNPATQYWQGEASAEKFAVSIVRECMSVIELDLGPSFTRQDIYRIVAAVKHHFGVNP
jgi:hypothetical protein